MPADLLSFALGAAGEIMVGLLIGLSLQLIFAGIQLAGQLAGFQMGFAVANIMDPSRGIQIPMLSQFNQLLAMLVFLSINAHHLFLRAVVDSFQRVPPFQFQFSASAYEQLIEFAGRMFVISIRVGAPVIVVLILTSVALGLMARTVPQMQILIVAMPVKITIGLLFIGFSIPYLIGYMSQLFRDAGPEIYRFIGLCAP
jgi:flagellar biosynthetic protein FliR